MSLRKLFLVVVGVWVLGANTAAAFSGLARSLWCREAMPTLVRVIYPVADLVVPVLGDTLGGLKPLPELVDAGKERRAEAAAPARGAASEGDDLVKLITSLVAPDSWIGRGGPGTLQYYPLGMSLVINATPVVQDEVRLQLEALRRLQDDNVVLRVHVLRVHPETVDAAAKKHLINPVLDRELAIKPAAGAPVVAPFAATWRAQLTQHQWRRVLEELQADPRSAVMITPRSMQASGQLSHIEVADKETFLVAAEFDAEADRDQLKLKTRTFVTGLRFGCRPTVAADCRSVHLDLEATMASRPSRD